MADKIKFLLVSGFILAVMVVCPVKASANTYYVATSGNDSSSGTQAQPWKTIQNCLNNVKAGDTCLIGGGTYNESLTIKTSGNNSAPINIKKNNTSDTVTVNSGGSTTLQTSGHQSWYVIDGIRLISDIGGYEKYTVDISTGWSQDDTATGQGNGNITLKNCFVAGSMMIYGPNNTVENCEFDGRGSSTDGIKALGASSTNTVIKNNTIHDYVNTGDEAGRAVWINSQATDSYITGNTVYNTRLGIDCDGAGKPVYNCQVLHNTVYKTGGGSDHSAWGCSIFLEDAFNAVIDGNLIYGTGSNSTAGIYIINYGTDYTDGAVEYRNRDLNAVISNNIVYGNGDAALLVQAANGIALYNNTISGQSYFQSKSSYWPKNWTIRNNIFYGSGTSWSLGSASNLTWSNNLYWNATKPSGDNSLSADPKFVSSSDFHLQSGSPAIDSGMVVPVSFDFDGNSRPQGAAFDTGAYEFVTGGNPVPTATTQPSPSPTTKPSNTPSPKPTVTKTPTPTITPTPTPVPVPGDANGDRKVDGVDYVIWLNNYNLRTTMGPKAGDFNSDGTTDGVDYIMWLNNYE